MKTKTKSKLKPKTYFSIRVIKERTHKKAIESVELGSFDEGHTLSDKVLTEKQLLNFLLKK